MIRSFQALRGVDPGFRNPETVQTFQLTIPSSTGAAADALETVRTQHAILDQLSGIAGVDSAGFVAFNDGLPLDGDNRGLNIGVEGPTPDVLVDVETQYVSPNFFETIQTPLVAGRTFEWNDVYDGRRVVLISEGLARSGWGSASAALGGRITLFGEPRGEVIGVVANVHHDGIDQPAPPVVAFPPSVGQSFAGMQIASFVVRTPRVGTEGFLEDLRDAAWSVNPNLALANVQTLGSMYQRSIARTSVTLSLLLITATIAMLLGLVGIYGVVSYGVAERRREIGIRLALGARTGSVAGRFVFDGLRLAILGGVVGIGAALASTRFLASVLYEISPLDPSTYVAVMLILVAAATLASYVPARRASALDPVEALKSE